MNERSTCNEQVRRCGGVTPAIAMMFGLGMVSLTACLETKQQSSGRPEIACYDALLVTAVGPDGRTGPVSGVLRSDLEVLPFECPNEDPFLGRGCMVDGRLRLGFGSAVGHRGFGEAPAFLRLELRPHSQLRHEAARADEVLWEGEIDTSFLSRSRAGEAFGCLEQELRVETASPLPPWPEPEPEPEPEPVGPCGPDGGRPEVPQTCGTFVAPEGWIPDGGVSFDS